MRHQQRNTKSGLHLSVGADRYSRRVRPTEYIAVCEAQVEIISVCVVWRATKDFDCGLANETQSTQNPMSIKAVHTGAEAIEKPIGSNYAEHVTQLFHSWFRQDSLMLVLL